jgi:segregation and condensation protein A
MARRGEIDPWNIDVVDVTDRFLKRIEAAKKLDLRVSGRVLLYAAILVRMKAEAITLEALGGEEEDFETYDYDPLYFLDEPLEFPEEVDEEELDEVILEALTSMRRRVRKITTLKDLIDELRRAEEVERRRRKRKRREMREEVGIEEALKVPHEESLEEMIARVEREVLDILKKKDFVTLFALVKSWDVPTLVDYYVSILHLAFRRKVEIRQEEFYGDVYISKY